MHKLYRLSYRLVSHNDNVHKSPSLLEISGCSLLSSVDQVQLETCDLVSRAIDFGRSFRLCSRPFWIDHHQWVQVFVLVPTPDFVIFLVDQ